MEGPRGVKKEEFESVINLVNSVFRPEKQSMQKEYEILFNEENLENLRIIVEDGKPVSHIGTLMRDIQIYNCFSKVGLIGSVCTHPDYRRRGYATLLLEDCIRRFDESGCDFMLVSGARHLYDSADCVFVGNVIRLEIAKKNLWRFEKKENINVENFKEENFEDIIKAYNEKKVKFIREKKDWEIALRCGQVMNAPSEFLIIKERGKFKGYLIVHFSGEKGDVREYGGNMEAMVNAIPLLFEQYKLQILVFPIPFEDRGFAKIIQEKGVYSSVVPIPGTVRILNFKRLMERLRPLFREKLGEDEKHLKFEENNGEYKVLFKREEFILRDRRAMTWLILSQPGGYEITGNGPIIEVLRKIFPIPFVWYGINYI